MSLYTSLKDAGCRIENRYSTLYTPDTEDARTIFENYGVPISPFRSNIDGKPWLEAHAEFDPYWERLNVTVPEDGPSSWKNLFR